jgi:Asp/Glu/hydantoin racemase
VSQVAAIHFRLGCWLTMVLKAPQVARILVANPNTDSRLTKTFEPFISSLGLRNTVITYWTCPTGPAIIKTLAELHESAVHCLDPLLRIADDYDGFLVAGYANHPLVDLLQPHVGSKPVVGIFEASLVAAALADPGIKFGIITTGPAYEPLLTQAVIQQLHSSKEDSSVFGGVAATGIGLPDLRPEQRGVAREKVMAATRRLIQSCDGDLGVICMGGVILAGFESFVHEASELELGAEKGLRIKVVDQLRAGMLILHGLIHDKPPKSADFSRALE